MTSRHGVDGKSLAWTFASLLLAAAVVFAALQWTPLLSPDTASAAPDFSGVSSICELATVRSFYHNVADYERQPQGAFKYGYGKFGYKKMWMEYSGIVEFGVDVNKVKISAPDVRGQVMLYVPEARVLNVTADKDTLTTPLTETGVLTQITTEDQAYAFSQAQATMRADAEADEALLFQARQRAKSLLKQYIVNTGRLLGREYTVLMVDDPALIH